MKLAEALSTRQDCQMRVEQLKTRIISNVKVQEGEEPSEKPQELIKELYGVLNQLRELVFRINMTNTQVRGKDGRTLTEMLADRDTMTKRLQALREIFDNATSTQERYSRSEIKYVKTIDVKALHKHIDTLASDLRKLDIEIQSINFTVELQ